MRLGILTFHLQLNYGGVLQALALQLALAEHGYDVCVVDRWLTREREHLRGNFASPNRRVRYREWLSLALGMGAFGTWVRCRRTQRFIQERFRLTAEHFVEWSECVGWRLPVDCLVVGSDQIWNCQWVYPSIYLLEDAPEIPAIAYAASFGMREIPEERKEQYRQGMERFVAISVRESEGIKLVESVGARAIHVVDPTILLEPVVWRGMGKGMPMGMKRRLVVYVLSENVDALLPKLVTFARRMRVEVQVLVGWYARPIPKSPKRLVKYVRAWIHPSVKLWLSAGPQEFLDAFSQADWVLSDSFHALMFSAIFDKQVAILRPESDERKAMFARIEEFVEVATEGPVIEDSVETALARFERGETMAFRHDVIRARREASWAWLKVALEKVERERAGMRSS